MYTIFAFLFFNCSIMAAKTTKSKKKTSTVSKRHLKYIQDYKAQSSFDTLLYKFKQIRDNEFFFILFIASVVIAVVVLKL